MAAAATYRAVRLRRMSCIIFRWRRTVRCEARLAPSIGVRHRFLTDAHTHELANSVPAMTTRLTAALGIRHPIVLAGMAGGPTTPELVAAVSDAGGLGTFGLTGMGLDAVRA